MTASPGPDDLLPCYHAWRRYGDANPEERETSRSLALVPEAAPLDPQAPLSSLTLAVLDTEATGRSHRRDRLLELYVALRYPDGTRATHGTLFDPGCPIPAASTRVHGIRDLDVRGKPSFAEVAPRLASKLEGAVLVAYNAPYDVGLLRAEFARAGLVSWTPAAVVDVLPLTRRLLPGLRSYKLGDVAAHLGHAPTKTHRARADVETLERVWEHLLSLRPGLTLGEVVA